MYIHRSIEPLLSASLATGKILVIYGARQVGKTTLLHHLFPSKTSMLYLACDEQRILDQLIPDSHALARLIGNARTIILDEIHVSEHAGRILKIFADQFPDRRVIATGSAAFTLRQRISEPLTGRHLAFELSPLTYRELYQATPSPDRARILQDALIYGSYPEIFITAGAEDKITRIRHIAENYLYKDILAFDLVRGSKPLRDLLVALALQIGQEVSYHELGQRLGVSYKTVERYIDLLEQSFVLFRLHAFSRNPRKELTRKVKVYFFDCGVRNAIINNFNPLSLRNDGGYLFENFIIADRVKREHNAKQPANLFFWRTYDQKEIDLVAEKNDQLDAVAFKWSTPKSLKGPASFRAAYPHANTHVVSADDVSAVEDFCGVER
jgi:predicted AAA+ superfamily ATPase